MQDAASPAVLSVVGGTATLVVGSALVYAGATKGRDLEGARIAVLDYRLLPSAWVGPAAVALVSLELLVGVGTLLAVPVAIVGAIILVSGFSAVVLSGLLRGLEIDCHCAGDGEKLGSSTLFRNALMLGALIIGLVSVEASPPLASSLLSMSLPHITSLALLTGTLATAAAAVRATTVTRRVRMVKGECAH